MSLALPKPLTEMLEKEWDSQLFSLSRRNPGLAVRLGWTSYHTLWSRGSQPGYPDRTLWKGTQRVIFAELKRELTGKASLDRIRVPAPAQVAILDGLARAGAECYLWRPSDLDEAASILGKPWRFRRYESGEGMHTPASPPRLVLGDGAAWVPRSIWIPGAGRADEAGVA